MWTDGDGEIVLPAAAPDTISLRVTLLLSRLLLLLLLLLIWCGGMWLASIAPICAAASVAHIGSERGLTPLCPFPFTCPCPWPCEADTLPLPSLLLLLPAASIGR